MGDQTPPYHGDISTEERELARLNHSGTHSCRGLCPGRFLVALEAAEATQPAPLDERYRALVEAALPDPEYVITTLDGRTRPMRTPADGAEAMRAAILAALEDSE